MNTSYLELMTYELKENMNVGEEDLHIEGDEDDIIDAEDSNDDVFF